MIIAERKLGESSLNIQLIFTLMHHLIKVIQKIMKNLLYIDMRGLHIITQVI